MDDRKLTVYNGRGAFKKSPPQILLQGNWLEQAGFSARDKITVKCQQGQLIITKDGTRVDSKEYYLSRLNEFFVKTIPAGK